jgi:hypothetical protein
LAAVFVLAEGFSASEPVTPTLRVTPAVVRMGAFYSGAQMRIEGAIRSGSEVVVVVRGADREETFNRKRRYGVIWINSGKVHVKGVPSLFLRFSDQPVRRFLTRQAMDRYQLDEAAIKSQMHIDPDQDTDVILASWLTLKAQEGSYMLIRDAVKMSPSASDETRYSVDFKWPKKAPPGSYQVRVYECRDQQVVGMASATLPVVKVGFPAWMAVISNERAFWYGVVCVLTAAIFGFGIDSLTALLFGAKAPSH